MVSWQGQWPGSLYFWTQCTQPAQPVTSDTPVYLLSLLFSRRIFTHPQRTQHRDFRVLHYSLTTLNAFCVHLRIHQLPLGQKKVISFLLTYFNLGVNSVTCQRKQLAFQLTRQKKGQTLALSCRQNYINKQRTFHHGLNYTSHQLDTDYIHQIFTTLSCS